MPKERVLGIYSYTGLTLGFALVFAVVAYGSLISLGFPRAPTLTSLYGLGMNWGLFFLGYFVGIVLFRLLGIRRASVVHPSEAKSEESGES